MESLLSAKPQRQRLAIAAVLVALPDDGPQLVKIVSQDNSQPQSQDIALSLLDQRRSSLIRDIFSNDKETRRRATADLIQGWQTDEKLVAELLLAVQAHNNNAPGVINALAILERVSRESFAANKDQIVKFLDSLRSPGPETAASHIASQIQTDINGDSVIGLCQTIKTS